MCADIVKNLNHWKLGKVYQMNEQLSIRSSRNSLKSGYSVLRNLKLNLLLIKYLNVKRWCLERAHMLRDALAMMYTLVGKRLNIMDWAVSYLGKFILRKCCQRGKTLKLLLHNMQSLSLSVTCQQPKLSKKLINRILSA